MPPNIHRTSRKLADDKLRDNCIRNGFTKEKADLIYKGVRVGGRSHWDWCEENVIDLKRLYSEIKDRKNFVKYLFPMLAVS